MTMIKNINNNAHADHGAQSVSHSQGSHHTSKGEGYANLRMNEWGVRVGYDAQGIGLGSMF